LPEPASPEATHVPIHRRFNRAAVYDRDIYPDLPVEQQSFETAIQPASAETQGPGTKNRLVMVLVVAVFLIAAGVTFALAYFRDRRLTALDTNPSAVQGMSARLGMRASQQGEDLLLSWDGTTQAVQAATEGLLQIDDGAQHREIALDHGGIANCSMLYKPTSDDVVFRLEVRGKEGVHGAESLEVVGARTRAADLEQPRPSAPAPEVQPEPDRPRAENKLPVAVAANRRVSKNNFAKPGSQTASRRPLKVSGGAAGRTPRLSSEPLYARQNAPSLPMSSITTTQLPTLSAQQLPKPPPAPSAAAAKSSARAAESLGSSTKPSSPVRDSTLRGDMKSAPASYVPPRPLKWTAPDAKSLGISRMSAATDVQIKVRIDDSGRVTSAHALLDGSTHNEAVTAAVTAAVKQWIFEPAKMQGKNVPSEQIVVIRVGP
jgi:hypothetical protein